MKKIEHVEGGSLYSEVQVKQVQTRLRGTGARAGGNLHRGPGSLGLGLGSGERSLYGKVQCIIGDGHMGPRSYIWPLISNYMIQVFSVITQSLQFLH